MTVSPSNPDLHETPNPHEDNSNLPLASTQKRVQLDPAAAKKADKIFSQLTLKITLPKIDKKLSSPSQNTMLTLAETHALLISTLIEEFGEDIRIYSN